MPIDFPTSPTLNQTYTYNSRTWIWDGTGWQVDQPEITFSQITTALGYTPLSANGGTISGTLQVTGTINTTSSFTSNTVTTNAVTTTSLTTSTVNTGNATTSLTISTGNTTAGKIVLPSTGAVVISPNSSINAITVATGSIANTLVTNATGSFFLSNVNIDSGVLLVDSVNNRVGINNTTPDAALTITGSANVSANVVVGNRVTANLFVGAAENPFSPTITVAGVAGSQATAPSISTAAAGTLALTANRQYFIPVLIPYLFTSTTLACEVTTLGTGSSIIMNVYNSDANGAPTGLPLATDVTVSSATIGVKTGSWVYTFLPGLYWASMVCNATAPTIRTTTAPGTIGVSTIGATPIYSYIYGTFTFGTMGNYSGVTSITGVAPGTQTPTIAIY